MTSIISQPSLVYNSTLCQYSKAQSFSPHLWGRCVWMCHHFSLAHCSFLQSTMVILRYLVTEELLIPRSSSRPIGGDSLHNSLPWIASDPCYLFALCMKRRNFRFCRPPTALRRLSSLLPLEIRRKNQRFTDIKYKLLETAFPSQRYRTFLR